MSRPHLIPIWKTAPFIRLLLPLIAGIMLQWYIQLPVSSIITALISFSIAFFLFLLLPVALRFSFKTLQGMMIQLLFISLGAFLTWQNDVRHQADWFGHAYEDSSYLLVRIDEPLVEKNRSFKADGYVESIIQNGSVIRCKGKLLLYFSKEGVKPMLNFGDRIIMHKTLQPIKNSGNPGAFNYERYAAFQGIFHNVFLKAKDWVIVKRNDFVVDKFKQFIFTTQQYILDVLRNNIRTGNDELAIAEALLIGYTNDLDKDLVQAYSNTGVVHIIAISGMHLGLIYVLLVWIFGRIPFIRRSNLLQLIFILGCLWLFSILTGASPSVLRAAVMFSCIAIGKGLQKKSSIYNALAASAFLLLCYDPFYLWSVGFQLSYLAVLGIVIFQKKLYGLIYFKHKWIDKCWQLISVSTVAQILTFPVCIYYFHQFPNLFLLTNVVAVPLSAIILYAEIALLAFSWMPYAGPGIGIVAAKLTWIMNGFILWVNNLPFAVWDMIPASVLSTWILYFLVMAFSAWRILNKKIYLKIALAFLFAFQLLSCYEKWFTGRQKTIIVYNVPQLQAIDLVNGNNYHFLGDSLLLENVALQNFHLKPGRIALRLRSQSEDLKELFSESMFYQFNNARILLLDKTIHFTAPAEKIRLDLVIISKNPKLSIAELARSFNCSRFIFDASNSAWKV
ncbi:MAG TPA: ComEC/Rec2 family competence protein, partial [Ferruginibacter sp.]|nr:ComEC/Rec2 family competence protein [Ferruginibacter sp.]